MGLDQALPPTAAAGVKHLALMGAGAFKNPNFWLQAIPAIRVLQLSVPNSMQVIGNISTLLKGWKDELLSLTVHWDSDENHDHPAEAPPQLLESICALKKLRRLELNGC